MPGPTTEVLSDDLKEIRGDLHKLTVEVAKLSAEFGQAKWLLGLMLMATLSGIAGGIWWAATLNAEVKHLANSMATGALNRVPPRLVLKYALSTTPRRKGNELTTRASLADYCGQRAVWLSSLTLKLRYDHAGPQILPDDHPDSGRPS